MPRSPRRAAANVSSPSAANLPANNTVKLPDVLRERIGKAMALEGFSVWAEFCRVALTDKCVRVEQELRIRNPAEYERLYGRV